MAYIVDYLAGLMFLSRSVSNSMAVLHTVLAAWKMLLIILLTCLISGIVIWAAVSSPKFNSIYIMFKRGADNDTCYCRITGRMEMNSPAHSYMELLMVSGGRWSPCRQSGKDCGAGEGGEGAGGWWWD